MLTLLTVVMLQAATVAPTPQAVKRSNALFAQAQAHFRAGKYAAALDSFEQSNGLYPHPNAVFNIAKCREALGQTGPALRAFHDYLRLVPDAPDIEAVSTSIAALEKRLRETGVQQVRFFSDPDGATTTVDGKALGVTPAAIELTPGTHTVEMSVEGRATVSRPFSVQLARSSDLTLMLSPKLAADAPVPPPMPPLVEAPPVSLSSTGVATVHSRTWTWVCAGVAGASLGVGVALGLNANGTAAALRTPHTASEAALMLRNAQASALGANVAYGLAGAAAITALVLFFVERS